MSTPLRCLAICRRCRSDERIASGADSGEMLLQHARNYVSASGESLHVRLSQCLHCCDGGHTVRVEQGNNEVALVGIRTCAELEQVLEHVEQLARTEVPASLTKRVWQRWTNGVMVFHRALSRHALARTK